jgi:hypothetical protein
MKRTGGMLVLLAALGGCMSPDGGGQDMQGAGHFGPVNGPGGYGTGGGLFGHTPSAGEMAANATISQAQATAAGYNGPPGGPSGVVQAGGFAPPGAPSGLMQAGGMMPPGMMPPPLPPPPGGGPVVQAGGMVPNAVAAVGAINGGGPGCGPVQRSEVRFVGPSGMKVYWFGRTADGRPGFNSTPLEAPGRYNFAQGAIYRLKLSDLPNRPGVDLYPTLEVVPSTYKTDAFLAHSAVPIAFTDEDFDAVASGNYLVKVVYLPHREYADVAITGPDEIVSTRLAPGEDPIAEACRRGSILLIIRLGNIDLEAPNTPAMDAPVPFAGGGPAHPGMMPPGMMPPGMMPPGMMPPGMAQGMMAPGMVPPPGMMPPGMAGPGPRGPVPGVPVKMVPPQPPVPGTGPVTQAPGNGPVQPATYTPPTPAQLAGQSH